MAHVDGDLDELLKNPPKCPNCGGDEEIIGCAGGKFIFRCTPCVKKSIRKIWEENK